MRWIVNIHLLYFDDCPSWQNSLENLKTALQIEGFNASVVLVKVENNDYAGRLKFLGSPSFQINGQDLWPEDRDIYSLCCRIYSTPDGMNGYPTVEMFRQKLIAMERDLQ
jgi:hypothetical protein